MLKGIQYLTDYLTRLQHVLVKELKHPKHIREVNSMRS